MITEADFGTHEECEHNPTKKTLTGWYFELITDDHPGSDLFWERINDYCHGEDIDIGAMPADKQFNLWKECSDGII